MCVCVCVCVCECVCVCVSVLTGSATGSSVVVSVQYYSDEVVLRFHGLSVPADVTVWRVKYQRRMNT